MSALDRRFAALSDPTRRAILERLGQGEATVADLSGIAPISQPALSRHLKVLEAAGLIETRIDAQRRPRRLRPEAVAETTQWLAQLQQMAEANFKRLDALLDDISPEPKDQT
ncbi:metalloregulator ArsR/SmtB family transcription factor [Rhodobacterales bacterium HKCCE4037]|nr:metalloregulator ArsR/SmtB family transcription factor [Rhodobacterales bacterium HKCCE4037]